MKSIRRTLLLWLFAGLTLGLVAASVALYIKARDEANEIFDYQMKQLAASLPGHAFVPLPPARGERPAIEDIIIQIWDENGLRIYHSHAQTPLPERAKLGFSNVVARDGAWRVYSTQLGGTVVQIAQPLSVRHHLAASMALRTVAPLLLLFPFLGGLIWLTVTEGLSPVRRVAAEVASRDAASLSPIPAQGLPEEIQPLTRALNDLLSRVAHSMDAQRAFVADAAHELRTPLTALKLQIDLAQRATTEEERRAAFAALTQGFERAMRLVQQLLTLARQEPGASSGERVEIDLPALVRSVVADQAWIADARGVDLGIGEQAAATAWANPEDLRVLLNNLIDNAVRYTPQGGKVDVSVRAAEEGACVEVCDTGPGIPEADIGRVFDRFYRVAGTGEAGSGLGLAIVKQIADAYGLRIRLENTGGGLCVRVIFPAKNQTT